MQRILRPFKSTLPTKLPNIPPLTPLKFTSSATAISISDADSSDVGDETDPSLTINGKAYIMEPNEELFVHLFRKCTQSGKLSEAKIVHTHFNGSKFKSNVSLQNMIVTMYCKCGSFVDARKSFDEMPIKDMVTWTSMITGYAQNDRPEEALKLFPKMLALGLKPNEFTFASLFKAAAAAVSGGDYGRQIHTFCVKCGFAFNVYVGSAMMDMYARRGRMSDARLVFDGLDRKNAVSYNVLIAGHARMNEGEEALNRFREMKRLDLETTHYTFSSVFSAIAGIGALEQGRWVHAQLIKSDIELVAFVGNTLLDMYAKSGSIEDARMVFNRLVKRDIVSWNSMLTGCAQHGRGGETIHMFEEMLRADVSPTAISFLCVLTACSHAGLLSEGEHFFEMMKKYDIEAEVEHYVTIVDLLSRAGHLHLAEKFIREMPIRPNSAVWGALLGACRMHKNIELGRIAAERVFELNPTDSGPHIILSNMYASMGMRIEAARVRKLMQDNGVKKEPACSWVQIENSVHVFVANDESHPMIDEIRAKWSEICAKIKAAGYVPDAGCVLVFEDEREREAKLQLHSEKLALAFAILSAPNGATIRIKKNVRICRDCHSAMKFASAVVEREIVVRDTNRFHHFRCGACSCGDYW
ncbi:Pentatricopeptide repeat-containing protein [Acorus gramineus]|uniref:Pentatricopeptide repeat-containing protein n=1 Tax=Acorus gramineus TaxID=55184 RepID=A0AAV9B783_ACOGR|nr:Pentatricopeptide repeat-containing protein [Acorus gramineus]